MDAFYAAIEQRDRPELRGKPVIIGGSGPRQVVSTCSYEARRFGVRSAMPGAQARRLCPTGIFVPPRMSHYEAVSAEVHAVFGRFTDAVESLSLDEAFLDVTGSQALFGDGKAIASRIKQEVFAATGLRVSVGVATSKYVAKVASDLRKPDALVVVPPGNEREFLAPLPVARLWGVGPATQELLTRAGLQRIADVQVLSREQLQQAFGDHLGQHLFVLAHGLDARPVESARRAQSVGHELTFAVDLQTVDEARAVLLQLSEAVGRRLRQAGNRTALVRLKLRLPDFTTLHRQRRIAATDDDLVIYAAACELLAAAWPGAPGLRLLGVSAAELRPAEGPVQASLFERPRLQQQRLLQAMDAIRDRHGEQALRRGATPRPRPPFGPAPD